MRLIEEFSHDQFVYLVTKYAPEGNLLEYMNRRGIKALTEAQAKSVIRQLLDALGQMHKQGLVHRDVKQLNIFVKGDGEGKDNDSINVKLGDFGMCIDQTQF